MTAPALMESRPRRPAGRGPARALPALLATLALAAPALAQTTVYADDFEAGATGWSVNTTTNNAATTRFLGRFDNSPTTTSRTFALPANTARAEIAFDFLRFDSWDDTAQWGFDRFEIEVDGVQVFSLPFASDQPARAGTTGNVEWSHTPLNAADQYAFNSGQTWYRDQFHRVVLVVDAPGPTLALTLRTALNQGGSDESGGYDNVEVLAFAGPAVSARKEMATAGYALPGEWVDYSFVVESTGGALDAGSFVITDPLPAEIALFTGDLDGSGNPVTFADASTPPSGLVCCGPGTVEFSDTPSGPPVFGYVPATPTDPAVTHIRITPGGALRDASADPVEVTFGIRGTIE